MAIVAEPQPTIPCPECGKPVIEQTTQAKTLFEWAENGYAREAVLDYLITFEPCGHEQIVKSGHKMPALPWPGPMVRSLA